MPSTPSNADARPASGVLWTRAERLVGIVLALAIVISDASRFLAGPAQLAFFDDDFFYYLQIARNLAHGHGSTFDGLHLTNGYHPLWMLALWLICLLPAAAWLPIVTAFAALSAWLCFVLARRILLLYARDPVLATAAAGLLGFATMFLNRGGMEIVLTLPLLFWLVYLRLTLRVNPAAPSAILYGLLGAAIILSRLDSILFIAPLFVAELWSLRPRAAFAAAGRLLLGLVPVPLYLLLNLHFFGTFLTVSSQAKQLEHHPAFSFGVIVYLFRYLPAAVRAVVLIPAALYLALAMVRLIRRGLRVLPAEARPIALSLLAFPILHVAALAALSDWPLWQWYLYSWVAGELGALLVLFSPAATHAPAARPARLRSIRIVVCSILFLALGTYTALRVSSARHRTGITFGIYDTAVPLAAFARDHPGIYAMGDRAGIPGYLIDRPLIQLEGLVMDRAYLDRIRRRQDLAQVLADYHVRYYVGSNLPRQGGCFLATEPAQAGSRSPKLKTTLCLRPIATWNNAGGETELFDLAPPR